MIGKYLINGRVLIKTMAKNSTRATNPNIISSKPSQLFWQKISLAKCMMIAQQTKQRKKKQRIMAQQISLLDFLTFQCSALSLISELSPIQGKILYTSVMLAPLLANFVHLRKMMMTEGAAMIVPQMYSEVAKDITKQYRMHLSTLRNLSTPNNAGGSGMLTTTDCDLIKGVPENCCSGFCMSQLVSSVAMPQKKQRKEGSSWSRIVQFVKLQMQRYSLVKQRALGVHVNSNGFSLIALVFRPLITVHTELLTTVWLLVSAPIIMSSAPRLRSLFGYTMYKPSLSGLNPASVCPNLKHSERLVLAGKMQSVPIKKTIEQYMQPMRQITSAHKLKHLALGLRRDRYDMRNRCFYIYMVVGFG